MEIVLSEFKQEQREICDKSSGTQSRQSARLFLQSSELGLPHPLPVGDFSGRDTLLVEDGVGVPSSDGGTDSVVL